jgi:hypothetical protein
LVKQDSPDVPCNPFKGECDAELPEIDTSDPGDEVEPWCEFPEKEEEEV